jgi:hypothetical protein
MFGNDPRADSGRVLLNTAFKRDVYALIWSAGADDAVFNNLRFLCTRAGGIIVAACHGGHVYRRRAEACHQKVYRVGRNYSTRGC